MSAIAAQNFDVAIARQVRGEFQTYVAICDLEPQSQHAIILCRVGAEFQNRTSSRRVPRVECN
jgi:hypothetical protein